MTIRFQVGFNRIVIVESKESTEPNNGLEIYQRHSEKWETQGIGSQYHVVDSVAKVVALIESLVDSVTTDGVPVLHLDMHGTHSGLELSNGGEVSWDLLRDPLSRLNSACNGRLVIVVEAAPHGRRPRSDILIALGGFHAEGFSSSIYRRFQVSSSGAIRKHGAGGGRPEARHLGQVVGQLGRYRTTRQAGVISETA